MPEAQPFSVKIEPGRVDPRRFWWSICHGARILEQSAYSYATRREAELAASEALKRHITRGDARS
jgi:hypothetical protein